jgi:hypothetical protein
MRAHIVSCLATAGILLAGVAHANIGPGSNGNTLSTGGMDTLGNKNVSMQVPSVQSMFPASSAAVGLSGASANTSASSAVDAWAGARTEPGSSESMLLAGGLLVLALIIRRISG